MPTLAPGARCGCPTCGITPCTTRNGDGSRHIVRRLADDEEPGGLGWLPDGTMLVAGMLGRVVYRLEGGAAVVHADLHSLAPHQVNDMIVGPEGSAYVTQFRTTRCGTMAPPSGRR